MKFTLRAALAAASVSVCALTAQAQTVLIANEPGPNRGVRAKAVEYIAEQVAARTNGEVTVDQNWGGALFKSNAALSSISNGVADMGMIIGAYFASEFPELAMGDLLLDEADAWVMMKAMNEVFTTNEALKQRLEDMNLVYIAPFATSQPQLACKGKDLKTVDDIRGTKIRFASTVGQMLTNLGGNMVEMPIYDSFQGLETGLLDCTTSYAYYTVASKMDELITSITLLRFSNVTSLATFMNKFSYDSLSEEQQAAITGMSDDIINYYAEILQGADDAAMKKMQDERGIPVHDFSAEDYVKMNEATESTLAAWKKDMAGVGADADGLLAEYKAAIAKWTEIRDTQGYPWAPK